MSDPCFSLGFISNNVDCDNGTNVAPNIPCKIRYITISSIEEAIPHNIDATVNPITETRKIFLLP